MRVFGRLRWSNSCVLRCVDPSMWAKESTRHLNMTAIGHKITIWNALWKLWTASDQKMNKWKEEEEENERQSHWTWCEWKRAKNGEQPIWLSSHETHSFSHSLDALCSGQMGRSLIVISRINSTMIYVILFTNILSRRRHLP